MEERPMSRPGTVAALSLLLATAAHAAPVPAPAIAEAQLRAINHRFVSAFAVEDVEYLDALTADDFLLTGISGEWLSREKHLAAMRELAVAGGVSYGDVRVRLFGPVALIHGLFEAAGADGPQRIRYTDVYHWDGAAWRLVNAQNTALRAGVDKALREGSPPAHEPWQGNDPVGSETEVLRELNANYVNAFRHADVAWYDAHLAPDYVVVNGDGSIDDRAQALAEFARPVFAEHMRSFPVDKVRIRRFGDVALIHAENDYELKDGRRGVSRYTDIWRKLPNGRWQCVAAHITRHKEPG
jgi:ketosteroid isomerase-like protein